MASDIPLVPANHDQRSFVWGRKYTSARYYHFLFERVPKHEIMVAIWSSKTLPKIKVFLWLLMLDRLNTRDIMSRKNWSVDSGTDCSLCPTPSLETRSHLFFECDFAKNCWDEINIQWPINKTLAEGFWEVKTTFKGPALLRSLHVLFGIFGRPEMSSFFRTSLSLWADGKLGFRVTYGCITTGLNSL
jgi:hypothetical protein